MRVHGARLGDAPLRNGACLDWIAHDRDLSRETLQGLLLGTLMGAVLAAEAADAPTEP